MNENKLMIFENPDFGKIRTVCIDGAPWFVAADVCRALEIGNPRQAVARLDEDEKMTVSRNDGHSGSRGGAQMLNYISESGLYTLVLGSRKPEAKAFKRWVTHEVIPSIRKYGAYLTDSLLEKIAANPTLILQIAERLLEEKHRGDRLTAALEAALPKAEYYDAFVSPGDCTNIRNTAKELGIPQCVFTTWLVGEKLLYRDLRENLLPYSPYMKNGMFIARDFVRNGHKGVQTLFTPFGKEQVRRMLVKTGFYSAC